MTTHTSDNIFGFNLSDEKNGSGKKSLFTFLWKDELCI